MWLADTVKCHESFNFCFICFISLAYFIENESLFWNVLKDYRWTHDFYINIFIKYHKFPVLDIFRNHHLQKNQNWVIVNFEGIFFWLNYIRRCGNFCIWDTITSQKLMLHISFWSFWRSVQFYLSLKKGMVLHLKYLNPLHPRMLCANFGWNWPKWFWRRF